MQEIELLDEPEEGSESLSSETRKNDNQILSMLDEYKTVEPPKKSVEELIEEENQTVASYKVTDATTGRQKKVISGSIISGAMLMIFVNNIVPMAVAMMHNKYAKGYKKIHPDELRLGNKQQKELQVFLDEAADSIQLKSDPLTMAALSLISLYGMQYWSLRQKELTKEEAQEKLDKDEKNKIK